MGKKRDIISYVYKGRDCRIEAKQNGYYYLCYTNFTHRWVDGLDFILNATPIYRKLKIY